MDGDDAFIFATVQDSLNGIVHGVVKQGIEFVRRYLLESPCVEKAGEVNLLFMAFLLLLVDDDVDGFVSGLDLLFELRQALLDVFDGIF